MFKAPFFFVSGFLTYFYFATDNLLFYYMLKKHSLLWLKKWNKLVNLTLFSGAMPTPGGLLMWKKSGFYQLTMRAQLWLEQKKLFADLKQSSKMSRVSLHCLGFFLNIPQLSSFLSTLKMIINFLLHISKQFNWRKNLIN